DHPALEDRRLQAGDAQDLEVVARVVAERRGREPLEGAGVGGRGAYSGIADPASIDLARDALQVATGLGGARRRQAVPEPADDVGEAEERRLGQAAGDVRHDPE